MNLELFPQAQSSDLDPLVLEIDTALDACFLADVQAALELTRDGGAAERDAAS